MYCWLNGQILQGDNASIPITDRGFLLGDGVFDTLLISDGLPQYFNRHINRLRDNINRLGIPAPAGLAELGAIIDELIDLSDLKAGRASLRTTITRGTGPRGLAPPQNADPFMIVTLAALQEKTVPKPVSLLVSKTVRRNEFSPLSTIKSLNYGDEVLAMKEAREQGGDNAVLLNTSGKFVCATNGNIYLYKNDQWMTPPVSDGVLNGTIRQVLVEQGVVKEESLDFERAFEEEEGAVSAMAYSNSLQGVVPVSELDGAPLDVQKTADYFDGRQWELEK